jgi:hypothetical protein
MKWTEAGRIDERRPKREERREKKREKKKRERREKKKRERREKRQKERERRRKTEKKRKTEREKGKKKAEPDSSSPFPGFPLPSSVSFSRAPFLSFLSRTQPQGTSTSSERRRACVRNGGRR